MYLSVEFFVCCLLDFLYDGSLNFLNLYTYVFGQIWEIFRCYFFKHFFPALLSFFSPTRTIFNFPDSFLSYHHSAIDSIEWTFLFQFWFLSSKISVWLIWLFELLYSVHYMNTPWFIYAFAYQWIKVSTFLYYKQYHNEHISSCICVKNSSECISLNGTDGPWGILHPVMHPLPGFIQSHCLHT